MPAGLTVLNTNNTIQIDENYRNMLLVASGQYTLTLSTIQQDKWYNDLLDVWSKLSANGFMAVRVEGPWGMNLSVGSFRGSNKVMTFYFKKLLTTSFQYYIYDLVDPRPGDTSGFQVFDASSKMVFNAYDYPMKIVQSVVCGRNDQNTVVFTGPTANYAYGCTGGGYQANADSIDIEEWHNYTFWSGGTLYNRVDYSFNGDGSASNGNWGMFEQYGVVVDVTNVPKNFRR